MPKKILVTAALPYANGPIHIGHLVEYIQTDIFVRFLKLLGKDAIYCCADDTHGTAIEIAAQKKGILPEQLIEEIGKQHKIDFAKFHIRFDSYYSTNSKENKFYSDYIFNKLKEKDLIYKKQIEQSFCKKCKRFLPDRYIKGRCPKCNADEQYGDVCEKCNAAYTTTDLKNPFCTICGTAPKRQISEHYFFKLSKCSDKLKKWLTSNPNLQKEIKNYVLNWIKKGLIDWDITRDGPYFGFKIPGEENLYYYVWLDAPIGYIASTQNYCKKHKLDALKDYWQNKNSTIIHFIGKDITYFHFLFWPAMLMESGINTPNDIIVHGFLTVNKEKMSKSRGTFFTAEDFAEKYNPEYLRYYYSKLLSKKLADIDLDFQDFKDSINNELISNIGNLCYRTLNFLEKNFKKKFKNIDKNKITEQINKKIKNIEKYYNEVNYKEAVKEIMAIASIGNKYFQDQEPWKLIKENKEKAESVLGLCINIVKNLSILIQPILPNFSQELQKQLNLKDLKWKDLNFNLKKHKIAYSKIIIQKMELAKETLFPLNLKIAKILEAKDHPDASKLYVMKIDIGTEKRTIVAGIKDNYRLNQLKNKLIVVVENLKPAKLRGIESKGMLLAAVNKDKTILLETKGKPGDNITIDNLKNSTKQISFNDFLKLGLKVKEKQVYWGKHKINNTTVDIENGSKVT